MDYIYIITRDADSPLKKQKFPDFIELTKSAQAHKNSTSLPMPPKETEVFFHSLNVDTSGYKFDREDANTR